MEKLVINVPDQKSALVKQILQELGVTIQDESGTIKNDYQEKLTHVSVWTDDDIKFINEAKKAFNNLSAGEW